MNANLGFAMHALSSISLLLIAALTVVPLARRLGLPSIIGYMLAGILVGPYAIGIIEDPEGVIEVADFGVAMLLFVIGLELDPKRLWVLRNSVFGYGAAQVFISGALLSLPFYVYGLSLEVSLLLGAALALSSTAFALQLLQEKNQLASRHGQTAFSILLFQDIAVVPLLAIIPLLAGTQSADTGPNALHVLLAVAALILASRFLVRPVFHFIANSQTPELFTGMALLIIVGTTWLMQSLQMSASLGAFLAGVLLADSEFRHELEAQIQPFKSLLLGLFFMTVGMTANLPLLVSEPHIIVLGACALVAVKAAVLFGIARASGAGHRSAIRLATAIPQGGEFAFILFTTAAAYQLMDASLAAQLVLAVTLSMALTPVGFWVLEHWLEPRWGKTQAREHDTVTLEDEHKVLIVGFGRVGQIVARVLRMHHIPFIALESSARQVDFVRLSGNKVYYGRPDTKALLIAAGVDKVDAIVLAIDDVEESMRTARLLRTHFPSKRLYARARDRMHAYRLMDLGIEIIHRESFASSLELAEDVLIGLGMDLEDARSGINRFRRYDNELIKKQQAIYQNEAELIKSAKQSMVELEDLFERDARAAKAQADAEEEPTRR